MLLSASPCYHSCFSSTKISLIIAAMITCVPLIPFDPSPPVPRPMVLFYLQRFGYNGVKQGPCEDLIREAYQDDPPRHARRLRSTDWYRTTTSSDTAGTASIALHPRKLLSWRVLMPSAGRELPMFLKRTNRLPDSYAYLSTMLSDALSPRVYAAQLPFPSSTQSLFCPVLLALLLQTSSSLHMEKTET